MPGPPPNPQARRRNDRDAWRTLAPVCTRPVPRWPIATKPRGHAALWRHLWSLPIAEIWHEQNAVRLVARYATLVLTLENVFSPDDDTSLPATVLAGLPAEIRQIEDRLLISPSTRIRARVVIAVETPADESADESGTSSGVARLDDYRDLGVG